MFVYSVYHYIYAYESSSFVVYRRRHDDTRHYFQLLVSSQPASLQIVRAQQSAQQHWVKE